MILERVEEILNTFKGKEFIIKYWDEEETLFEGNIKNFYFYKDILYEKEQTVLTDEGNLIQFYLSSDKITHYVLKLNEEKKIEYLILKYKDRIIFEIERKLPKIEPSIDDEESPEFPVFELPE